MEPTYSDTSNAMILEAFITMMDGLSHNETKALLKHAVKQQDDLGGHWSRRTYHGQIATILRKNLRAF